MQTTITLQQASFYLAIVFTVLGGMLGLAGVWIEDFWKSDTPVKLLLTDLILAGSSIVVAAITKWLGGT